MFEERRFDLEGGQFISAALDDIHREPAHDPVVAGLEHGHVAGPIPAAGLEGFCRGGGLAPVFREHVRSADLDLARGVLRGDDVAVLGLEADLDAGERLADRARATFAAQGIGDGHADLGHAIALEEFLPREGGPLLMHAGGQGRGTRDHQAQALEAVDDRGAFGRRGRLEGLDELHVDRGHGHEERVSVRLHAREDRGLVELRERLDRRARPEGAAGDVDDAVDVMHRQEQRDAVGGLPGPGLDEAFDLRGDVGVGRHDALGFARRAAGVEDHRAAGGRELRQFARRSGRGVAIDQTQPEAGAERGDLLGAGGVGQDDGGAAVGQRVFPFRLGGRQADRHLDRAGPPEAPLRGHVAGASRGEEGDARLLQVVSAGEERRGERGGAIQQLLIGRVAGRRTEGDGRGVPAGAGDERKFGHGQKRARLIMKTSEGPSRQPRPVKKVAVIAP